MAHIQSNMTQLPTKVGRTAGRYITTHGQQAGYMLRGCTFALQYVPLEKVPKGTGRQSNGLPTYHWRKACCLPPDSHPALGLLKQPAPASNLIYINLRPYIGPPRAPSVLLPRAVPSPRATRLHLAAT